MTKQEFLDKYRAHIPTEWWTEDGFQPPEGTRRYARECSCEYEGCEGWCMDYDDDRPSHTAPS